MPLTVHSLRHVSARGVSIALALLSALAVPQPAFGLVLHVNTTADLPDLDVADGFCDASVLLGEQCTLRAAAQEARFSQEPDTIHLAAGTYTLTIEGDDNHTSEFGDLDFLDDVEILGPPGGRATIVGGVGEWTETLLDFSGQTGTVLRLERLELKFGGGFEGGALRMGNQHMTIRDCWLHQNFSAGPGGAIFGGGGTLTIERTTVEENVAATDGGAIADYDQMEITIRDSTISGNLSHRHGAAIFSASDLYLTNVTISGNRADGGGGAIYQFDASTWAELANVTIYGNRSDFDEDGSDDSWGGGIVVKGAAFLANSVLAGNSSGVVWAGEGSNDCFIPSPYKNLTSLGYLFLGEECGGSGSYAANTGDVVGLDPELGPLQRNGGPTPSHRPLPGSPLIDSASSALPPASGACAVADQRGVERPQDGDESGLARCDFGAVEFDLPIFVDGFEGGLGAWSGVI